MNLTTMTTYRTNGMPLRSSVCRPEGEFITPIKVYSRKFDGADFVKQAERFTEEGNAALAVAAAFTK